MDHFGIGTAIKGMVSVYFQSARRTGRTTSLVESVKNGDRIIFADTNEARRVKELCKNRGVEVECITVNPRNPEQIFNNPQSQGRTICDHTWVEEYWENSIQKMQDFLDKIERESSGYGAAHRETRQKASIIFSRE